MIEAQNTIPTIIKRLEQTEINDLSKMLSDVHMLPVVFVKKYLKTKGKKDNQIENILNQMIKRKLAFYDETKTILKINKAYAVSELNQGIVKSLWLLLDLQKNVDEYFIQSKTPHTVTFFNSSVLKNNLNPVYDVFYIPYGREQMDAFIMNEIAKTSDEPLNSFVILDDEEQIKKLKLSDKINIVSFVKVSQDGKVKYIA